MLTVTGFSQQVPLENLRPHSCCDPLAFVYNDLIFFTDKITLIKTDNTKWSLWKRVKSCQIIEICMAILDDLKKRKRSIKRK